MSELLVAVLLLAPILGGLVAWGRRGTVAERVAQLSFVLAAVAGLALAGIVLVDGPLVAFGGIVVLDALGAYLLAVIIAVAALALGASPRYIRHEIASGVLRQRDEGRYYALFLGFVASLLAVPLLDNLGLLWVAIEATTIVSALLVGITRTPEAIEAAWKYLVLGTVGVGFALLATILAYASSVSVLGESSDALNWTRLVSIAPSLDPNLMRLAFVFALAGYGTKAGLVPFHTWLPDAHSQAPSPISALLSGASLAAALYALSRFHLVAMGALGPDFSSTLLVVFGLLSLAVALPFMVAQEDLKRLLAYSSIEHMGLLTLGIGFGGPIALLGVTLHLGLHALLKASLFLAAGELVQQYGTRRLSRMRGALRDAPGAAGALGVGIILLGGLPPSGIFVTEFAIVVGGVLRGYALASALAALLLALSFVALAFHGAHILWGKPVPGITFHRPGRTAGVLLGLPLAIVAVVGLWMPGLVQDLLAAVGAVLGGSRG
jgi:hydrogenase-4 component F